jgi:hypothetical protein
MARGEILVPCVPLPPIHTLEYLQLRSLNRVRIEHQIKRLGTPLLVAAFGLRLFPASSPKHVLQFFLGRRFEWWWRLTADAILRLRWTPPRRFPRLPFRCRWFSYSGQNAAATPPSSTPRRCSIVCLVGAASRCSLSPLPPRISNYLFCLIYMDIDNR